MRYYVFGDMHDNSGAFGRIPKENGASYICLGDILETDSESAKKNIDGLLEIGADCVSGNHDRAVVDDAALEVWKRLADMAEKERWKDNRGNPLKEKFSRFYNGSLRIREELEKPGNGHYLSFLKDLQPTLKISPQGKISRGIQVAHSHIGIDEETRKRFKTETLGFRLLGRELAGMQFNRDEFIADILLVGDTHVPLAYIRSREGIYEKILSREEQEVAILEGNRYILNPGALCGLRKYIGMEKTHSFGEHLKTYALLDSESGKFEIRFL